MKGIQRKDAREWKREGARIMYSFDGNRARAQREGRGVLVLCS